MKAARRSGRPRPNRRQHHTSATAGELLGHEHRRRALERGQAVVAERPAEEGPPEPVGPRPHPVQHQVHERPDGNGEKAPAQRPPVPGRNHDQAEQQGADRHRVQGPGAPERPVDDVGEHGTHHHITIFAPSNPPWWRSFRTVLQRQLADLGVQRLHSRRPAAPPAAGAGAYRSAAPVLRLHVVRSDRGGRRTARASRPVRSPLDGGEKRNSLPSKRQVWFRRGRLLICLHYVCARGQVKPHQTSP